MNSGVFAYVETKWGIPSFDFWNLTLNAMASDGVHYLSEVNLLKAVYFVSFLDLTEPIYT